MELLPLFAFGTLRRGEVNHHYLEQRYFRWLPATLFGFRSGIAAHGFPAVVVAPGHQVTGELFFLIEAVADETLRHCDILEDLPPGELKGDYYQRARVRVQTPEGQVIAWAYLDPLTPIDAQGFAAGPE